MRMFELIPDNGRKSFYGKALVRENWNKSVTLVSYVTDVCSIDSNGNFIRHWPGYSLTTMTHINTFRRLYGYSTISKKQWEALPVESICY